MKNLFKTHQILASLLSILISVFLVTAFVYAATTIGANVNTGGTLTVTGASTLSTASTSGDFWLGNVTADDDDYLYFDASSSESLMWDDAPGHFVFSDGLEFDGATSTDDVVIGASSWGDSTSTLMVAGSAHFTGIATSSDGIWAGAGGTINNINMTGGDLYVQDGVEIDGGLWVDSATTTDSFYVGSYASSSSGFYSKGVLNIGGAATIRGGIVLPDDVTTGISIATSTTGITLTGDYTAAAIAIGGSSDKAVLAANDDHIIDIYATSGSTDGSNSVRPLHMRTTMTGTGGVGGRAEFEMNTEAVLGGWANAIKGYTDFGTAGSVTGLGSAIVAEMRLPAKTLTGGNYAPLELELVVQTSGTTGGTPVSFIYAELSGDDTAEADFQSTGYVMKLQGLGSAGSSKIFQANTDQPTHALRILIGSTPYYLLMTSVNNGTE